MYKTDGLKEVSKSHKKISKEGNSPPESPSFNSLKRSKLSGGATFMGESSNDEDESAALKNVGQDQLPLTSSARRSLHTIPTKKTVDVLEVLKAGGNLG